GMRRLFTLLASANKNAAQINKAFANYDEKKISLDQLKKIFTNSLSSLAQAAIASMPEGKSKEFSISETIKDVSGKFKDFTISDDDLRLVQIVKKLFVGGQADIISCDELRDFLRRMPSLSALTFDMLYVKDYNLNTTRDYAEFALARVDSLFDNIPLHKRQGSL